MDGQIFAVAKVQNHLGDASTSGKAPSETSVNSTSDAPRLSLEARINDSATKWMEKNRSLSLRQTPIWAQGLAGGLLALGSIGIIASIFYKIDEVVTVQGQLKSIGGTVEVKAPIGGRIHRVFFQEGDAVKKGDLLVQFDTDDALENKKTYQNLIMAEEKLIATNTLYLNSLLKVEKQRLAVLEQKVKTKSDILKDLSRLQDLGGYQRIVVLEKEDELLELKQITSSISEKVEQLNYQKQQIILDSGKKIQQLKLSLAQSEIRLRYQNIVAPVDGVIFDQKASNSGVLNTADRLLSIVSQKGLYAQVNIPNQDIGYIKVGQDADVRIDAFPFTQFGSLKGNIVGIGADALEPTNSIPFYSFLAKIDLKEDYLTKNGRKIFLKPGMSITSNLNLGSKPVISLVSDMFVKQLDSVKGLRQAQPN
tara:strand:+ start:1392 stop:2657 length:1266 start_codon:yes stop_codon:yes gene_type:complete